MNAERHALERGVEPPVGASRGNYRRSIQDVDRAAARGIAISAAGKPAIASVGKPTN